MRQAKQGLWTNGAVGAIVEGRPIDPGQDDARHDCPTAARGDGSPDGGRGREESLGCTDGPRTTICRSGGWSGAACATWRCSGEHWLALVGWHAGAFKLKARDRWIGWLPEQQFRRLHLIANNARVPHLALVPHGESGLAGVGAEPSPALRRLPHRARPSGVDRRDVRGHQPLRWDVLPGGELATVGANPRLCPPARHAGDLGSPRETEGDLCLPAGARCARAALAASTMRRSGKAKATRGLGPRSGCEACGSVCTACPISAAPAGGAIRWRPSWPSRSPRSWPDTAA